MLIYYPIDKGEYLAHVNNPSKTYSYLIDGKKCAEGAAEAGSHLVESSDINWFYRALFPKKKDQFLPIIDEFGYNRIKAVKEAGLHKDFKNGGKLLTPVVFSHGYGNSRGYNSILATYLASYGCIVFSVTHTDGTADYTCDYSQNPPKARFYNHYYDDIQTDAEGIKYASREEYFSNSVETRAKDIEIVIDYMKECKFSKHLDMKKVVVCGHSLGGITAIESSIVLGDKIKVCVAMDPYFNARLTKIRETSSYFVAQQLLVIHSETFNNSPLCYQYNIREVNKKFWENIQNNKKSKNPSNGSKNYDVHIKGTGHMNQIDPSLLCPFVIRYLNLQGPIAEAVSKMDENNNIILAFLEENEFLPVKFGKTIQEVWQK